MKNVLTIVPSRGRNTNHKEVVKSFKETAIISDLCVGLDDDDEHNYEKIDGVIYEINPSLRMNGTLNLIANKYADKYEYIYFMGDDHRPRSFGWDSRLVEPLKNFPGVSFGNDLLKKGDLPTAAMMTSQIVKKLGFFSPPILKHFYLDNFWKDLGLALNNLNYLDDVIIEHMHPVAKKSKLDATYSHAWAVLEEDSENYKIYKETQFALDIKKITG